MYDEESIRNFFQTVHNYLEKDLEYDTASELFSEVTRFFSSILYDYLPFLQEF